MLYFEWDRNKAAKNEQMHGINFLAARAALEDPYAIEEPDQTVDGELRLRTTGMADGQVVVLVSHTNRPGDQEGDEIARIIHARKASPGERREYDEVRASGGGTPLGDEERAQLRALAQMPDSEIDFSDIPERIYDSERSAVLPLEEHTVTLRVDAEVAEWLEGAGMEAAQEINLLLRRTAQRRGRLEPMKAGLLQKAS